MITNTESGPTAATEINLATIEVATRKYADERDELNRLMRCLNDQVETIKRSALTGIKRAVAKTADKEAALRALVEAVPYLFLKPRTVLFHGIKVGWEKGKGRIVFSDPDRVVELIHKHFPDLAPGLIITKESPDKKSLTELSAAHLKRLGITIEDAADHVIIRATDSEIDKVVTALLKEAAINEN